MRPQAERIPIGQRASGGLPFRIPQGRTGACASTTWRRRSFPSLRTSSGSCSPLAGAAGRAFVGLLASNWGKYTWAKGAPEWPFLSIRWMFLTGMPMPARFPPVLFARQVSVARYYCPELPRSSQPLEVVCAGWEECRPDYDLVRSSFPWFGVELIARGRGWVEMAGDRHLLRTGTVFCYGPATSLRITADRQRPFLKYFVIFAGTRPRRAVTRGPLRVNGVLQALYPQELQELLEHVVAEGNRKAEASAAIATDYLRIFFRKLHESTKEAHDTPVESSSRALASFLHAKSFLEENFMRLTRAESASHELGMAPETLCRLFQRFSEDSPYQLLVRLRVNLAVDLLISAPDLLVKQVAERAGFDDPFHFSRVFKRIQGISPAAFRRMHGCTGAASTRGALTPP